MPPYQTPGSRVPLTVPSLGTLDPFAFGIADPNYDRNFDPTTGRAINYADPASELSTMQNAYLETIRNRQPQAEEPGALIDLYSILAGSDGQQGDPNSILAGLAGNGGLYGGPRTLDLGQTPDLIEAPQLEQAGSIDNSAAREAFENSAPTDTVNRDILPTIMQALGQASQRNYGSVGQMILGLGGAVGAGYGAAEQGISDQEAALANAQSRYQRDLAGFELDQASLDQTADETRRQTDYGNKVAARDAMLEYQAQNQPTFQTSGGVTYVTETTPEGRRVVKVDPQQASRTLQIELMKAAFQSKSDDSQDAYSILTDSDYVSDDSSPQGLLRTTAAKLILSNQDEMLLGPERYAELWARAEAIVDEQSGGAMDPDTREQQIRNFYANEFTQTLGSDRAVLQNALIRLGLM